MKAVRSLFAILVLLLCVQCKSPPLPPPPYHPLNIIPAGSRIEFYAQVDCGDWKPTLQMNAIPRPMNIREAEKWALSAAQQRLGGEWRDYRIVVKSPQERVVIWQRHGWQNL